MHVVRLGAVSYLNTKPLVYGLEQRADLFSLRFDVPARCAALLHQAGIDLGLIPAVEYLRGDYRIVPGVAIGSNGPVDSVAIFSRVPIAQIKTLAMDSSSRTSAALTRILFASYWQVAPKLITAEPNLHVMLTRADAALVIGDPALQIDERTEGLLKIDLGLAWQSFTGLPFVYAIWSGREGACQPAHVTELNAARDRGCANLGAIAAAAADGVPWREAQAMRYLGDNLRYDLGEAEIAGLRRFHELAAEHHLVHAVKPLRFFVES